MSSCIIPSSYTECDVSDDDDDDDDDDVRCEVNSTSMWIFYA